MFWEHRHVYIRLFSSGGFKPNGAIIAEGIAKIVVENSLPLETLKLPKNYRQAAMNPPVPQPHPYATTPQQQNWNGQYIGSTVLIYEKVFLLNITSNQEFFFPAFIYSTGGETDTSIMLAATLEKMTLENARSAKKRDEQLDRVLDASERRDAEYARSTKKQNEHMGTLIEQQGTLIKSRIDKDQQMVPLVDLARSLSNRFLLNSGEESGTDESDGNDHGIVSAATTVTPAPAKMPKPASRSARSRRATPAAATVGPSTFTDDTLVVITTKAGHGQAGCIASNPTTPGRKGTPGRKTHMVQLGPSKKVKKSKIVPLGEGSVVLDNDRKTVVKVLQVAKDGKPWVLQNVLTNNKFDHEGGLYAQDPEQYLD